MNRESGYSRRDFIYAASLTALLTACKRHPRAHTQAAKLGVSTPPDQSGATTAVSLAALQEHFKQNGSKAGSEAATIPGINRISGFLLDGSDVVLFGHQQAGIPAIEADAFVVALRNAYGVGEEYQGDPGCTIDPIPGIDPFKLQKVSVFGVPVDCIMAARHVSLDYELKRAGAGIPGTDGKFLPSSFELSEKNGPCSVSGKGEISVAHRFWFYPKTPVTPRFERDRQTASILRPIAVQLLTEQEFLNSRGERTGATTADPEAQDFADAVTALLASDKVVRYSQMVHDFRVIEVARLIHFCGIPGEAISHLLGSYELQQVKVPAMVIGVIREEDDKTLCPASATRSTNSFDQYNTSSIEHRYEYRGGVQAKVQVADKDTTTTNLDPLKQRILDARPSREEMVWHFMEIATTSGS